MKKRKDYDSVYLIIGLGSMIIGVILEVSAYIKEYGIWSFIGHASIQETKVVFTNHPELAITGIILCIIGYLICAYIQTK